MKMRRVLLGFLLVSSLWAHDPEETALKTVVTESLVSLLGAPVESLPKEIQATEDPYEAIVEILRDRRELSLILRALERMPSDVARDRLITSVLYHDDSPRVGTTFAKLLSDGETRGDYFIAQYLAKRGDKRALEILNRHYFSYPVSSLQWSFTVELFARFNFRPAIPRIIESLDAASLNLAGAAVDALQQFYPDAPRQFGSLKGARDWFTKRWSEEQAGK